MEENTNIWLSGVMGVVVGNALGCPVQFETREEVAVHPITGMRGYGTFNLPEGSWTDDSSLTLALMESISRKRGIDLDDIMGNFMKWLYEGKFTPYNESFDIGCGTMRAINRYRKSRNAKKCGGDEEYNNGNGSLMRILPACIYCSMMKSRGQISEKEAVETVHAVGSLTHAHMRANIACGLYFFMVHQILTNEDSLRDQLQSGLRQGFAFYETYLADKENLRCYDRMKDLTAFLTLSADSIKSSGYVVDALEAAVWSLGTTDSFEDALLKAVNLGNDTDTVGAITGGLAGLYYGYGAIPEDWLSAVKRRKRIEKLCIV